MEVNKDNIINKLLSENANLKYVNLQLEDLNEQLAKQVDELKAEDNKEDESNE